MRLTNKGLRGGWHSVGECELGEVKFVNWLDASFPHCEEVLKEHDRPFFEYSVIFVPPKRKRTIHFGIGFDKRGEFERVNYWSGKFTKKQIKAWTEILSDWLINNGFAEN